ncbi:MAG TPA: bifunctional polysaccharide deacetylase/glycosyltransferase family 2 protein [Mycobacteriales bacterium]|nr:bifunctional polysaccharide deacetylase/glycosyltransferase family 2 protein [Mycobacteriales bacterium]
MTVPGGEPGRGARQRRPRAPWGPLLVALVVVLTALLLQGFTQHQLGRSSTGSASARDAAVVPGGEPILFQGADGLTSRGLPDRTVALTFDDGPDRRWTVPILDVLAREEVPATFFVVGSRLAHDDDLVRRELADGHEIGSHTWTHADLSATPRWRQNLELSLNQLGLAGSARINSALLRPPYCSTPDAVSTAELAAYRRATEAGYVVVLADHDSQDWRRSGVDAIVANSAPDGDRGAVVMFHDAGGDRSQTVEALPRVIAAYKEAGFRFTTVSGGLGLADDASMQQVDGLRRAQGAGLLVAERIAEWFARGLTWLLLPLGVLAVLRLVVLMLLARFHVGVAWRRIGDAWWLPPVTVLVPAYNEAVGIAATVRSIVAGDYPQVAVVVVDDGSTDGTAQIVEDLALPGVVVVRQENAGKAAALTHGISLATTDVIVMVDGDTVFDADALRWLVQPLTDPRVGAVSGNTKVGNRRGLLGRWQHLEYVVGFNLDRRLYDLLRCMPTVPGAIGAFRRSALMEVGGVSSDTLAEDTDLTMAVSRAGWRVVYEERAIAWTEAPATLTALWRQRYRWCYGTLQSVWKHRGAIREPGQARYLGRIGLPYLLLFQVTLPLLAPVIDVFAIYGLLFLDPRRVIGYWVGFLLLQMVAAAYALHLDKEKLRPLWSMPLQQFVYRQLMYLVVIQSVVSALSGIHLPWHKLDRTGLDANVLDARA